ncbi:hypothetical protein EON66_09325 [archaeon]|nr:MAG: hypothetical protein EON66_09325 [archaeon]
MPVGVSTTSSSGRGMGTTSASRSAESALPSVEHSVRAHGVNASASGAPDFPTADSSPTRRSGSVLSGFSEMSSMTDLVSGLGTLSTSVPTAAMGHALYPHPSSFAVTTPDSGSVTPTNATISAEALRQLKFEKRQLQHTLRQFEREFEEREGRKVSCPLMH